MMYTGQVPVITYQQFKNIKRVPGPSYAERLEGSKQMRKYVVAKCTLGGLSILAGITTVFMASANPQFPFIIGTEIWNGALCVASGGLAYRLRCSILRSSHLSKSSVCVFVLYGVTILISLCLCVLGLAFNTYGISMCVTPHDPTSSACLPRREPNLAMAVTNMVLEIILFALMTIHASLWFRYRSAFGFGISSEITQHPHSTCPASPISTQRMPNNYHGYDGISYEGHSIGHHHGLHPKPDNFANIFASSAFYESKKASHAYCYGE